MQSSPNPMTPTLGFRVDRFPEVRSRETPMRSFHQVFQQPWTTADQRKREVEAMRGAGVVQATRNSWLQRLSSVNETPYLNSPNRRPLAAPMGIEWDSNMLEGQSWGIKQQDPVYAPQAYTPMTLHRSFYDQVDNKLPYQPGEYASASAASEIDGPLSNRGYPEYFDTITSAGPDINGKVVPPTPQKSAALFDAALLQMDDCFEPLPATSLQPAVTPTAQGSFVSVELGRTNSTDNDRDEMEARLAGVSKTSLAKLSEKKRSPGKPTGMNTKSFVATPPATASVQNHPEIVRVSAPPPPLLAPQVVCENTCTRIDFAAERYITPSQVQRQRLSQALGLYNQAQGQSGTINHTLEPYYPLHNYEVAEVKKRVETSRLEDLQPVSKLNPQTYFRPALREVKDGDLRLISHQTIPISSSVRPAQPPLGRTVGPMAMPTSGTSEPMIVRVGVPQTLKNQSTQSLTSSMRSSMTNLPTGTINNKHDYGMYFSNHLGYQENRGNNVRYQSSAMDAAQEDISTRLHGIQSRQIMSVPSTPTIRASFSGFVQPQQVFVRMS